MDKNKTCCPWHPKVALRDVPLNHFYHRRGLKGKVCPKCGFLALFATGRATQMVAVGGRVVEESAEFG